jgi:N6-L-threonylcarbamoyladenine synthase
MTNRPGLDFSFSGLKTHTRTTAGQHTLDRQTIADIALAFEIAVVETLVIKCKRALKQTDRGRLVISGGVGANERLRQRLRQAIGEMGVDVFYPRPDLCTDNGAMIAYAGYVRLSMLTPGQSSEAGAFDIRPRWNLEDI